MLPNKEMKHIFSLTIMESIIPGCRRNDPVRTVIISFFSRLCHFAILALGGHKRQEMFPLWPSSLVIHLHSATSISTIISSFSSRSCTLEASRQKALFTLIDPSDSIKKYLGPVVCLSFEGWQTSSTVVVIKFFQGQQVWSDKQSRCEMTLFLPGSSHWTLTYSYGLGCYLGFHCFSCHTVCCRLQSTSTILLQHKGWGSARSTHASCCKSVVKHFQQHSDCQY